MSKLRLPLIAFIAGAGVLAFLGLGLSVNRSDVSTLFRYQFICLGISSLVVIAIRIITKQKLEFLRLGEWKAPAQEIKLLGVKAGESWLRVGGTFAFVVSIATAAFMYFGFSGTFAGISSITWFTALGLALPLSIMNSLNEELVTRWSVVEGLSRTKYFRLAPAISATIFGTAHYFGTPGGLVGVLMAGFLGWLLSRSIQDARGIGWAWLIHCIQDVIILTVLIASSI
jgi:membrane protease YdiL (CAAX protease family)